MKYQPVRILSIIALGATLTIAACSGDQPKSEETTDTATTAAPAEARTYISHGIVTKIDSAQSMITLDHQNIGDYMEAMTMPFKVADPAILGQVQVGDSVEFTLSVTGDQAAITSVTKVGAQQ